ncbi:hypothetical protein ABPG72_014931 [Tetrahymena utriculariae]
MIKIIILQTKHAQTPLKISQMKTKTIIQFIFFIEKTNILTLFYKFKRQINNLICDLEYQQKQIEKNFQSGYSAQEEGYKGRVLGIQVLRKNIKPFYCWQPCFENAEQVKHNKEDLEEIKQFYNSSKQKSVLEKYSLILTKGQLDIVFNCLENQFSILESSQKLEPTKKSIDKPPLGLTSQIQNNQSICQDVASLEKAQAAQMGFS